MPPVPPTWAAHFLAKQHLHARGFFNCGGTNSPTLGLKSHRVRLHQLPPSMSHELS